MAKFQDGYIDQHIQRVVCARCYGELSKKPLGSGWWEAYCPHCEDAWGGAVVRRSTVEIRHRQALADYVEMRYTMPDLFPSSGKNNAELLAEIGF